MFRSTDFLSVASRVLLACLGLQLFSSACGKQAEPDHKPMAMVDDASVAADSGETRADAGARQQVDAATDEADASKADAAAPPEDAAVVKDAGKTEAPELFDLKRFSTNLAKAVCDSLRECLGEQKLRAFVDNEDCEVHFAKTFAQSDFGSLHDSVESGRMQLHPDGLEKCYADTRKLGCAIQTERLPASCQSALKGTVKEGESCRIGADCAGQTFCPASECPRVCTARRAAAGSCERDEECLSGLICVSGQCSKPAALDQACAGTSKGVCELGKSCVGSTKEEAGKCVANADVQVGGVGDVCTPGGTLCQEGLSCAYDGDQGFNCQEAAESGASCHLALPTQCPATEYCTAEDVTSEGKCAALPKDGEACVLGSECAGGHVCLRDAESGAVVCKRVRDLGEQCTVGAMCRSGSCANGKCAATAACD
ncbi:MAG TPA: dickkopf-related protein [Polyangiales bacterium]|nr:dickkopf-related protein [Polyangiales bacterium]